jgi:xanthine dehydrogenase accessory factor
MPANEDPLKPPQSESIPEAVSRLIEAGLIATVVTVIQTPDEYLAEVGRKLLVADPGVAVATTGTLGSEPLDRAVVAAAQIFLASRTDTRVYQVKEFAPELGEWGEARLLFERVQSEPALVICGAGHVGAALARIGSLLGYRVTLIDDRAEFIGRELFAAQQIELVFAANWSAAVLAAVGQGRGISVAIVTRGHSEDEQCLRAALMVEADYVGLIGSKRRTSIVLERLRASGADEARLAKVHAPVGLDLGAVTPEEVALAIMAEVVAVRRGGKGGSLSAKMGKGKG